MYPVGKQIKTHHDVSNDEPSKPVSVGDERLDKMVSYFLRTVERTDVEYKLLFSFNDTFKRSLNDLDHLRNFRELKELAAYEHQDKFQLILLVDEKQSTWSYKFLLGDHTLYASEARVLTKGREFTEFQDEYFLQAFQFSFVPQSNLSALQEIRSFESVETINNRQQLDRFKSLIKGARSGYAHGFEKHLFINSRHHTWTYRFSIDGVFLYSSPAMDIQATEDDLLVFQIEMLLQDLLKALRDLGYLDDDSSLLRQLRGCVDNPDLGKAYLGPVATLAINFEPMAKLISESGEAVSVEFTDHSFSQAQFHVAGRTFYEGAVTSPAEKLYGWVTPRVQLAMSALRIALYPLQAAAESIFRNLDSYRAVKHDNDGKPGLTLTGALTDPQHVVGAIHAKRVLDPTLGAAFYELDVSFGNQETKRFALFDAPIAGKAAGFKSSAMRLSDKDFRFDVLTYLCAPVAEKYAELSTQMGKDELVALSAQLYKTRIDSFSLGEIFRLSSPSTMDLLTAFDGQPFSF